MKIIIIIAVIIVVLAAVALIFMQIMKGPDLSHYKVLKEPRITTLPDRKVVEITVQGEPEKVLMKAFQGLMKTYFRLKGVPKGPQQPAPCLRCPRMEDGFDSTEFGSNTGWEGRVAMPVPEHIAGLPGSAADSDMDIHLTTWEYGSVAEILHIGPYKEEVPTIKKLETFITDNGYSITGNHEEEYLRGPGMPFVRPEDYYTIIRYRVIKK